jgi:hypothetical protein
MASISRPKRLPMTGTQGVVGNPNCPPPVLPGGITPKNWSCKTGQQARDAADAFSGRGTPDRASGRPAAPVLPEKPAATAAGGPPPLLVRRADDDDKSSVFRRNAQTPRTLPPSHLAGVSSRAAITLRLRRDDTFGALTSAADDLRFKRMIIVRCILAGLLLANPTYAQQQNVLLERAGVFPDAPPNKNWTIEDGKIVHKDAAGVAAVTWTKPPLEIDEEGFTLTMTIDATMNMRAPDRVACRLRRHISLSRSAIAPRAVAVRQQ